MAQQNISDYQRVITAKDICKSHSELLLKGLIEAIKRRRMDGYFCQSIEEANELVLSLINEGDSVSWGGSMTIRDMGLTKLIKGSGKYNVMDRDEAGSTEEMREIQRQALLCDTFIMSTNAMTNDGELVNIDGLGNRVAALCYGPKQVIVVVGINKIMHSEQAAIERARNVAAPINMQRFTGKVTPCTQTGKCGNCSGFDSICGQIVITRFSMIPSRIKIVVVNDNLGF
ncbi:MAG: lactate utilization protein [Candidatus Metalachnospira sp.]|nr:lactate utilization protein [Candidatus Metalachnospira sp.]